MIETCGELLTEARDWVKIREHRCELPAGHDGWHRAGVQRWPNLKFRFEFVE